MYKLIIYDEKGETREFDLSTGTYHLGRSKKNDIYLNDQKVSRSHAQIQLDPDGRIFIKDLDSKEGVTVNGESIHEETDLKDGDEVKISSFTIEVKKWNEEIQTVSMGSPKPLAESKAELGPDGTLKIDPDDSTELPRYHKLLIVSHKRFGEEYLLDKSTLTIGSSASRCDILIDEKNIADEHARVVVSEGESVLKILATAKGILVNGKQAKENTPLKKGDCIEIGSVLFRFIDKDEVVQKDELESHTIPKKPGNKKTLLMALVFVAAIVLLFVLSKPQKEPSKPGGSAPTGETKGLPEKDLSAKQEVKQKPDDKASHDEGLAKIETDRPETAKQKTSAAPDVKSSIIKKKPTVNTLSNEKEGNRLIEGAIEDYFKGNNDNALNKLNAVLKLDLEDKSLLKQKASNLSGDLKSILDFFQRGHTEYNDNQIEKAFATWSQGLILEKKVIGEKISHDSGPIRAIIADREAREARKAFENGDFPAANKFCEKALAIYPKHKDSLEISNLLYLKAKKLYEEGYIIKNLDTDQSLLKMKEVLSITSPGSEYYKKANSIITAITGIKH